MNVPGRPDGNWRWRCTEDMLSGQAFERMENLTKSSNRLGAMGTLNKENTLEVVSG
jgi:4-alpha-glucanotransferase